MPEIVQFLGEPDGVYFTDEPGEWFPAGETCIGGTTRWIVPGRFEITGPCGAPATHRSWAYLGGYKVMLHLCQAHADAMDPPNVEVTA